MGVLKPYKLAVQYSDYTYAVRKKPDRKLGKMEEKKLQNSFLALSRMVLYALKSIANERKELLQELEKVMLFSQKFISQKLP